ncbi:metal-dependent transcriptional regulator [Propionibacterium sp.]|uniref:metal-dependent transcriptional regulator n=1 Tax=Propionibacterium sp. TaxID=1977903 RepID=UPI0039ED9635
MPKKPATPTPNQEQCLKVVWDLTEQGETPVTNTELAKRLGLGNSTVSDMVRRLVDGGFLNHEPYGAIRLTDSGSRAAVRVVRRHRILETCLAELFGYAWDEVHEEADALEHAASDELINRMERRLGHPRRDPHGDPIPSADGEISADAGHTLDTLAPGKRAVVARVTDREPELLRYLAAHGVRIGSTVVRQSGSPLASDVTCAVPGSDDPLTISARHAQLITVTPARRPTPSTVRA